MKNNMENIDEKDDSESLEGVPSLIKSWKQIYWFVIIEAFMVDINDKRITNN